MDNVTQTDKIGRELFGDQYISLKYEDLIAEPWPQMRRLWAFLDVDVTQPELLKTLQDEMAMNPDKDWQRKKAKELTSPLQKGKSGTWQQLFSPVDRQVFKEIGGETLIQWGYEESLNW